MDFHETMLRLHEEDPYRPIVLHISSYGGEIDALFSMLDTMDAVRSSAPPEFQFLTVAKGKACSAGAVLLAYGDIRFATPNTRLMLHQATSGHWGSHPDNEVEFRETSRMNNRLLNILKKRCKLKMSIPEFKKMLGHNLYFTPQQAKAFGLIDIIGYPRVTEHLIYDVTVLNGEAPPRSKKGS